MRNWSIDEEKFKQLDPKAHEIWRMGQMINYGCQGEKISFKRLVELLPELDIDDDMRVMLEDYIKYKNEQRVINKRTDKAN